MQPQVASVSSVTQRWERPEIFDVEPGHWKKQLPSKYLNIAAKGDVRALRALLKEHPDFLNKRGPHKRTLLWEATRSGRMEAVKFLVERGADVNATGCYNSETHVQVTPYCAARYYKRGEIAAYLGANGASQDIFRAAFLGDQRQVERELAANPELLNAEDPCDEIYFIPLLSFAAAGGYTDLTGFLIERGAEVVQYSAQLLYLAAKVPRMDLVELLVANGADVRAVDSGIYGLISDLEIMRYLLRHGASANQIGKNGFPPLVYLARGDKAKRPDKLEVLLDHGADVNAIGPHGKTALHYAATGGHSDVVAVLLDHGANVALKDDQGETALSLARTAGKTTVVELLKSRGAHQSAQVTFQTVRELGLALPEVEESTSYGTPALKVRDNLMARMREGGETLVVKCEIMEREFLMQTYPETFYITDHYRRHGRHHAYMLVRLSNVSIEQLRNVLKSAWLLSAPKRLIASFAP